MITLEIWLTVRIHARTVAEEISTRTWAQPMADSTATCHSFLKVSSLYTKSPMNIAYTAEIAADSVGVQIPE